MKQLPNEILLKNLKTVRDIKEQEFVLRQKAVYYTKVSELSDEELNKGLEILRKSNDDECMKW